jgi:aminoglycoside phosphotransferase (APT) family kinase protein
MNQTAAYLRAVLAALRTDLTPHVPSDVSRHRAELIDFVLTRLVADMSAPAEWRETYWKEIAQSLGSAKIALPPGHEDTASDSANAKKLSDLLKTILGDVVVADGQSRLSRTAIATLTRRIAEAESAYRNRFETLVQSESRTAPAGKITPTETRMTAENVTAYLRKRFSDMPDIRATAVTPIPGGRSKGTTLFNLEGHPTFPREVVLRQDLKAEVGGQSVTYEYPLQEVVWRAGLPIPQPLWVEQNETILGGPFSAFVKSPGTPGGTLFRMDSPPAVARDAAEFFGRLHSLDIQANDLRARLMWGQSQMPVRDMLDFFYAKWKAAEVQPCALIETSFLWLYDHLDVIAPRAVLVHGDSSYHNMLVHEGRLSVVLDWEFAHAGDPAEDLLGSEHFTTQVLPWPEFMRVYRENGGGEIGRERFRFFALWRSLRFAIATAVAGHAFATGVDRDLRLAAIGYNSFPRLLQDVARQLAAAD